MNSFAEDHVEKTTVWYDPALTSIETMENVLKSAGVYLGTDK